MTGLLFSCVTLGLLLLACVRPFVGVILWTWISIMNPHRVTWGPGTDLPWALLACCATVIGCVIAREPRRPRPNSTILLIAAFCACITLTSMAGQAPSDMIWSKWDGIFKTFVFLALEGLLLTDRRRIHAMVWILVISLGCYGVKGGLFTLLTAGAYRVWGPPGTMIGDNNHLAAALLVVLPLMNYLRTQSPHRLVRTALLAGMVLTLFAVLASYSRGAMLGLLVCAFFFWWSSSRKLLVGAAAIVTIAAGMAFMPDGWTDRMHTIQTYSEDGSATGRLDLWSTAWKLAIANPVTGVGFMGTFAHGVVDTVAPGAAARAVHSIWFETLAEQGFPTFLIWFALTVIGLVNCRRIIRATRCRDDLRWAHDLGRMGQISICSYLTTGTFLSLEYWDGYFTLLVVIAAAGDQVKAGLAPLHGRARPAVATGVHVGPGMQAKRWN